MKNLSKWIIREEEKTIDNPWIDFWTKIKVIHGKLMEEYMRRAI